MAAPWCDQSVLWEDFVSSRPGSKPIAGGRLCQRTQISAVKDEPSHRLYPISCTVNLGVPSLFGLLDYDTGVTVIYVLVSPCHP